MPVVEPLVLPTLAPAPSGTCRHAPARPPRWPPLLWGAWLTLAAAPLVAAPPPAAAPCRVLAVVDAAKLRLACPEGERRVALAGLHAPRPGPPQQGGEAFAAESRELAREWLTGRPVELLAWTVRLDGRDVREELLARGWVQLAALDPADEVGRRLIAAERSARAARRGLWSLAAWVRHRDSVTEPTLVPPRPPPVPAEPLGQRAARLSTQSWEERKAAFESALADLERGAAETHEGAGAIAPAPSLPQR
jgi:endonuclease YncB( thermonuclease family)